jgi:hypothetical protein
VVALQVLASLDTRLEKKLPYEKLLGPAGEYPADLSVDQLAGFAHKHFDETSESPVPA